MSDAPRRRLLMGGTFDPIHAAHVRIAERAGELLGADRVSLIPAASPPHKPDGAVASGAHRLAMAHAAVADIASMDVLDIEIERAGVSYTVDTVEQLRAGPCRGESLIWLIGQDQLALLPDWHRVADLARIVGFAVVPRPGAEDPDWDALRAALGDAAAAGLRARWLPIAAETISSTAVRQRIAERRPIRCWVPDPVADYIEANQPYPVSASGPGPRLDTA